MFLFFPHLFFVVLFWLYPYYIIINVSFHPSICFIVFDSSITYSWFSITFIEYIQTPFRGKFMFSVFFLFVFELKNEYHYLFSIYDKKIFNISFLIFLDIYIIHFYYHDSRQLLWQYIPENGLRPLPEYIGLWFFNKIFLILNNFYWIYSDSIFRGIHVLSLFLFWFLNKNIPWFFSYF